MNERSEQLKAVFSDKAFVRTLLEAENEAAAKKLLADKGAALSDEEFQAIGEICEAVQNGAITQEQLSGELDESALEQVAGGIQIQTVVDGVLSLAIVASFGYCIYDGVTRRW